MMNEDQMILLECLADDDQWQEWEREAAKYEVTMDYYIAEFV
jgi:hypothetical protein